MKTRDELRKERRKYQDDVSYQVWRNGGNPDRVDYGRVENGYYEGRHPADVARAELQRQRPKPVPEEQPPCEDEDDTNDK